MLTIGEFPDPRAVRVIERLNTGLAMLVASPALAQDVSEPVDPNATTVEDAEPTQDDAASPASLATPTSISPGARSPARTTRATAAGARATRPPGMM